MSILSKYGHNSATKLTRCHLTRKFRETERSQNAKKVQTILVVVFLTSWEKRTCLLCQLTLLFNLKRLTTFFAPSLIL